MVILSATQKVDEDPTRYTCELLDYNSKNDLFIIELGTDNRYKPPIKIISDKAEIEYMTSHRLIKAAYDFAQSFSRGEILVMEYAVVRISGWMSKEHIWWKIIDDDSIYFSSEPIYTFEEYAALVEHGDLEGGITQNMTFDPWRSFNVFTVSKYDMTTYNSLSPDEKQKIHIKHINDFMWKNYEYFDAIVKQHEESLNEKGRI